MIHARRNWRIPIEGWCDIHPGHPKAKAGDTWCFAWYDCHDCPDCLENYEHHQHQLYYQEYDFDEPSY